MSCAWCAGLAAADADAELAAIRGAAGDAASSKHDGAAIAAAAADQGTLLQRRFVLPFLLACLILACNQATGMNSVLAYSVNILEQGGLAGSQANWGDVALKLANALVTVAAVVLVDRKGRRFLLMLGCGGIIASLCAAGALFLAMDHGKADLRTTLAPLAKNEALTLDASALRALAGSDTYQLEIAYSYGPLTQVRTLRAGQALTIAPPSDIEGDSALGAAFRAVHLNPFPDMRQAQGAPLVIERARLGAPPSPAQGWLLLACLLAFVSSFAVGPGVCVWLALSELMPNRIRSNGMSVALLLNQLVSTSIAAVFLPTVGQHGYAPMFFAWAGCTVVYFLAAAFLLPETRGKTLEEIGRYFEGRMPANSNTTSTYAGTGYLGMYSTAWAHVLGVERSNLSRTIMQVDIGALAGKTISSAVLSFELKEGETASQNGTLVGFDADANAGKLAFSWNAPGASYGSVVSTLAGRAVSRFDVTGLLAASVAAQDSWVRAGAVDGGEQRRLCGGPGGHGLDGELSGCG
eukprot:gene33446-41270_t